MTGKEVVARWLLGLWTRKPSWIARMPDREDVDDLIRLIDEALKAEGK